MNGRTPDERTETAQRARAAVLVLALLTVVWSMGGGAASPAHAAGGSTLYVDGSVSSSGNCTTLQTACKTISAALTLADAPNSGVTAIDIAGANPTSTPAFNGVYCEQITIDPSANTSLTLASLDAATPPTIDGGAGPGGCTPADSSTAETPGQSVVTVGDANSTTMTVTLQGLTIQHGDASSNPHTADDYPGWGEACSSTRG